jgi:hypothetical protein
MEKQYAFCEVGPKSLNITQINIRLQRFVRIVLCPHDWDRTIGETRILKRQTALLHSKQAIKSTEGATHEMHSYYFFTFVLVYWGEVRPSLLGTSASIWAIVPAQDGQWWWWMWSNWQGNRSTQREPAHMPLSAPQIPHDMTWDRIRATQWEASD